MEMQHHRTMKVLCFSAPRSGSSSVGQALKILGYKTFAGMAHNFFEDNQFARWDEAIEARYNGKGKRFTRGEFDQFLESYEAVSGWGAAMLADDLFAAYPNAKVILATRDADNWMESFDGTIVKIHKWWRKWWWILPFCDKVTRDFRTNAEISLYAWIYPFPYDRGAQRRVYREHNEHVRELVPKEQLLEYNALEGDWKKLCEFLGKPVPVDQPYPHAGNREGFHKSMNMIWRRALVTALARIAGGTGLSLLVLLLVLRYWRKRKQLSQSLSRHLSTLRAR